MTTNATNKVAAVICRRFTKNVLYQCDLKWELPFSPLYTKDFLGSNVSSVVNSIFIAVKSKTKDGGPIEFIDQQDAKKIINP
jgi:hypothetical protein